MTDTSLPKEMDISLSMEKYIRARCACSDCVTWVNGPGYIGHHGSCWVLPLMEMINVSLRQARIDSLEQAARLQCYYCRTSPQDCKQAKRSNEGQWSHQISIFDDGEDIRMCHSSEIYELIRSLKEML